MKTFTFTVVIKEGCDEFWEALEKHPDKGMEELTACVKEFFEDWDADVTLTRFNYAL